MKSINLKTTLIMSVALALILGLSAAHAANTMTKIPAWFNGRTVSVLPAQSGFQNQAANPLYVVPGQDITHVLGVAIPGMPGYTPFWDIKVVTVLNGRDVSTNPFTSEAEILTAFALGEIDLLTLGVIVNCPVVR